MQAIDHEVRDTLENELTRATENDKMTDDKPFLGVWQGYLGGLDADVERADTAISRETLERVIKGMKAW